ncbi:helix-turn-helix domain-containing protein [Pseudochryseolinea flava]|uniref:DNA-binding protein n=1 Tax=Pseudochryseolinea flava TaxID=2059302 RepID=A0A364Y2Y7_9BACT|nr:helix-turn-helix domain-containing protein [Pseudochryseolinea flava]RAW01170.1 DNA-binding protein [Pseudochryseolinea flava]
MAATIITLEDLEQFKKDLLNEIRTLLTQSSKVQHQRWLKSQQVRKMLGISPGTLQHLRITGQIPFTKLGGVLFYDIEEIERILIRKKNEE